jgi:uncharacterized protein YqeY
VSALAERIGADVKTAMREKNVVARDTLRMIVAALKNKRIELGRDLEDADEVGVLQKAHKSRLDSAQQYADAGRQELADKERAEATLIEAYLEKKQMGQVMKAVMAAHKGQVDGKLVQKIAGELLS